MAASLPLCTIAEAFAIHDTVVDIRRYGHGRINDTYRVRFRYRKPTILQRLHPIFGAEVLEDHAHITERGNACGLELPHIIRTRSGALCLEDSGRVWRMLTFIPGSSFEQPRTITQAEGAAALVGRFHACGASDPYRMRHVRPDFHATAGILRKLRAVLIANARSSKWHTLHSLAFAIVCELEEILREPTWEGFPDRIIHGDLKFSNVRFDRSGTRAIALLDLDTMANETVLIDLADAARSWANPSGEDDPDRAHFDDEIFRTMLRGYLKHSELDRDERTALPNAILRMTLELAARFAIDAFEESYFRLDRTRYPTLCMQNMFKARTQLALAHSIRSKRSEIRKIALAS